jgi:hypothetical protein
LVAPYGEEKEARGDRDSAVRRWEDDVWKQTISVVLSERPDEVDYAFRRKIQSPARSRHSATRPAVLNWFKRFNWGRSYVEQVKPFNFLLTFFPLRQEDIAVEVKRENVLLPR